MSAKGRCPLLGGFSIGVYSSLFRTLTFCPLFGGVRCSGCPLIGGFTVV